MTGGRAAAWAELLRVSALFSVPGDALAGAAAAGVRPNRGTAWAVGSSLCLYEAGMALNDWADREEDAAERPRRPIPSGRVSPRAALGAAAGLTAAGLLLASRAGRPAAATAGALAVAVWAYDLRLKHGVGGPVAMAAARSLDLLLGATATVTVAGRPGNRPQTLLAAAALGAHTCAVTAVSRHETTGGRPAVPAAALAAVTGIAALLARPRTAASRSALADAATATLALHYADTAARPLAHAALNPSPQLTGRAVGRGIGALIPLQATLAARSSAPATAAALTSLLAPARRAARRLSPT